MNDKVTIYLVIAFNRVQLRTHNLTLATTFAGQLDAPCVVETEDFVLIAEYPGHG